MTKYIVKNCPCCELDNCICEHVEQKYCADCTDCPTKQVIELCMSYPEKTVNSLSNRILQNLQVEEVE